MEAAEDPVVKQLIQAIKQMQQQRQQDPVDDTLG